MLDDPGVYYWGFKHHSLEFSSTTSEMEKFIHPWYLFFSQKKTTKISQKEREISPLSPTSVPSGKLTYIAPENRLLEKEIPIGNHHF